MKFIPQRVTQAYGRTVLKTKKNSPHIFFAAGIGGIVVSHILVARATLKLEPVVDEIRSEIDAAKANQEAIVTSDRDNARELAHLYLNGAVKLGKLYGPSFIVGVASITALTKSHVELNRRNAALAAAYTGISQAFEEYRDRVREELGEEKERDIYVGATESVVEKDGKKKKVLSGGLPTPYARYFDRSTSSTFSDEPGRNEYLLTMQQNYWNQRLHAIGHVFLNEIYDSLGMERSREGSIVGWIVGGPGDDFVDFGLYEGLQNSMNSNPLEWSCLLDFNVNGVMYDKI